MEKDFHFYLIEAIVKLTEFDHPDIIAYSSQFVDDNNEGQFSIDGQESLFPEKIKSGGGNYYPLMTQSLSPKSLDPYVQKYVYVPFHFLPGDNTVEIKGEKNSLSTTPNSKNGIALLRAAFDSGNPYRIGIALHTFADTWSHQNFTGLQESWNSVYPWYNVFKSIVPNIGHAEAGHSPDVISEDWTDHRLGKKISNTKRAFDATAEIYKAMRKRSGKGPVWKDIKKDFRKIINASGYDDRKVKINDLLVDNGLRNSQKYVKDNWIDEALEKKKTKVVMSAGFEDTHWFQFHQAAKAHFAFVMHLIRRI